jgi:uncharacterized protein
MAGKPRRAAKTSTSASTPPIKGAIRTDDYRNEPNTMGWVVEIDPFDPNSVPETHHWAVSPTKGCLAVAAAERPAPGLVHGRRRQNEYIYKFVSRPLPARLAESP